jgi:curved DNA-binding protein CbpA
MEKDSDMAMKNYYRILQVSHEADQQEITASYRRLIRTCHPDVLSPDQRDDPAILQKVQELNEAYEVLGDKKRRLQYDLQLAWENQQAEAAQAEKTKLEERVHLVRCGKTGRTFKAYLARREKSRGPFKVQELEPLDTIAQIELSGAEKEGSFRQAIASFARKHKNKNKHLELSESPHESNHLSKEIEHLLNQADTLTMGDIDWNRHKCPDCGGMIQNPNGTLATWIGCSKCGHLRCAGNVKQRHRGTYSKCPWCGKTNRLTRSVPLGTKDKLGLKGTVKHRQAHSYAQDDSSRLRSQDKHELGAGDDESTKQMEL